MINKAALDKVFNQVKNCLQNLVGGSGHLGSYNISVSDFKITNIEKISSNQNKYHFKVKGYLETEFSYEEPVPLSPEEEMVYIKSKPNNDTEFDDAGFAEIPDLDSNVPDSLSGYIILDSKFNLCRDEDGKVLIHPWNCIL